MRPAWLLAIAATLSASPAAADITARYVNPINNAVAMTVEVNDKGDSRVSMDNQMAVVTVGGVAYILASDLSGIYAVRQDDWISVQVANMRAALPADFAHDFPAFEAVEGGTETVGRWTGKVWQLRMKSDRSPPPEVTDRGGFEFVVSADPDLAQVGRALEKPMNASFAIMAAISGPADNMATKSGEIFARGTVIRMSRLMRLDSVDTSPVAPSRFSLPAAILTREQYAARIGARPR